MYSFLKQIQRGSLVEADGVQFKSISDAQSDMLTSEFSVLEIEATVRECDGNKSPGPDGYNFMFVKKFWHLLKDDVCRLVAEFHGNGILAKGSNASFVALIPKKESPCKLDDYRPISLVGCIYKILVKFLAWRMSKVIKSIISENQPTFMKGRNLLDGVMVINELCDCARKSRQKGILSKVDFEKAYDSVRWEFLDYMLGRMGFSMTWRKWIQACLGSSSVSVLVNGSPTDRFPVSKGLRQGDPMALFLFLMVAEGLSGIIKNAVDKDF